MVVVALFLGLGAFGPLRQELRAPAQVTAWQFDVGQGDCSVISFPDDWSALIDTGGRYGFSGSNADGPLRRSVLPFLLRHGLADLDAVILTHGHLDHTGGARALAQRLPVDRWFVSGRAGEALTTVADSTAVVRPKSGFVLHRWRQWTLSVVYPLGGEPDDLQENDYSLVVVLRYRQRDLAVWSGDLERSGEFRLLASGRAPRDLQVWKAGHHGSNTSGTAAMLARFAPALVIISCGIGNTYGHPNHGPYVVRGDTVALARTDLHGSIKLKWDGRGRLTWRSVACGPRRLGLP
jgi:competence protein ComEC